MAERIGARNYARSGLPNPATKWTIEVMAGAILAVKESGQNINARSLEINYINLYRAIKRFPGGWGAVISAAGFDPMQEVVGNRMKSILSRRYVSKA